MSEMEKLKGILPAAVTPFDESEELAQAPFEMLLESLYGAGVDGVYVCGGTGEGLLQTVEQRKRVAEAAVRNSPKGKQVVVHVGSHRTADAVELAAHAGRIGASAVSALPPLGNYSFARSARTTRRSRPRRGLPCWCISSPARTPGSTRWIRFWSSAAFRMWRD